MFTITSYMQVIFFFFFKRVTSINSRSGFMWYAQDKRPKIKGENPGATVGEIAKKLGEEWGRMTDDQKAPYNAKQKKDRERYEREMAAYRKKGAQAGGDDEEEEEEEEEYSDEAED